MISINLDHFPHFYFSSATPPATAGYGFPFVTLCPKRKTLAPVTTRISLIFLWFVISKGYYLSSKVCSTPSYYP